MSAIPTVFITAIATALLAAGGYAVGHKQGATACAAAPWTGSMATMRPVRWPG